jgi:hypothetical protein
MIVESDFHEYAVAYFTIPRQDHGDWPVLDNPVRQWFAMMGLGVVPPPAWSGPCCYAIPSPSEPDVGRIWLRRRGSAWTS